MNLAPVFITPAEREEYEKIESKTVKEIQEKIHELANLMPSQELSDMIMDDFRRKKNYRKNELISFYKETKKLYEEQLALLSETLLANEKE